MGQVLSVLTRFWKSAHTLFIYKQHCQSPLSLSQLLRSLGFFRSRHRNWSSTYSSCQDMSPGDECLWKTLFCNQVLGADCCRFSSRGACWRTSLVSHDIRWDPLFKLSCPAEACWLSCFLSDRPYFSGRKYHPVTVCAVVFLSLSRSRQIINDKRKVRMFMVQLKNAQWSHGVLDLIEIMVLGVSLARSGVPLLTEGFQCKRPLTGFGAWAVEGEQVAYIRHMHRWSWE